MPPRLPPFLHREITRHGRPVWYFRRGKGPRIRMPGICGSVEFLAAYDNAMEGGRAKTRKSPAGSFAWALSLYRQSQTWGTLSPATRRLRDNIFAKIVATHGETPLRAWKRGDIAAGRDKRAATPAAARHFVEALRGLFRWLLESGLVASDPTEGVIVMKPKTEGFAPWTPEDEAAFCARWPLGTRERIAFAVLRETGLRRGDAAKLGRPHLKDGVIRIATEKTGERVAIAVSAALAEAIAAGPIGELTFIAGEAGRPMTKESFGNWFREAVRAAGVTKSPHGLRKAAATADALAGWTDAELDAKFGWTGRRMASLYTRAASREKLSLAAAKRTEREQEVPHPTGKLPAPIKQNNGLEGAWEGSQASNVSAFMARS
jgi:integrase